MNNNRPSFTSPRRRREVMPWLLAGVMVFLIAAIVGAGFVVSRVTERTVTITVTRVDDQTHVSNNSISHQYLIFTDSGVYKDADSFWFFKFNSSDLFGELQTGRTYRCLTTGARIPLISSYRNLIKCTEGTR